MSKASGLILAAGLVVMAGCVLEKKYNLKVQEAVECADQLRQERTKNREIMAQQQQVIKELSVAEERNSKISGRSEGLVKKLEQCTAENLQLKRQLRQAPPAGAAKAAEAAAVPTPVPNKK